MAGPRDAPLLRGLLRHRQPSSRVQSPQNQRSLILLHSAVLQAGFKLAPKSEGRVRPSLLHSLDRHSSPLPRNQEDIHERQTAYQNHANILAILE